MAKTTTKRKIINDPVYGFITIPIQEAFKIIEHPYFQRLRRIKQLGLTHLVYPGALHTRFHHAIGAMYLMSKAVETIRKKGHEITEQEEKGVLLAILLHDIGHGPFSHTLEHTLIKDVHHEELSMVFMKVLNVEMNGELDLAIQIFKDDYHKRFLYQLVSSQLDMDRLDYLRRDSFFTGVSEGVVGSDRLIKMLDVVDDNLVVEEKGVYSVESFIVARRIMYWQVYLHKTVVSAELMLVQILLRAKELIRNGHDLFASPALSYFLKNKVSIEDFNNEEIIALYASLDDTDVMGAIKIWQNDSDQVLAILCKKIVNRQLFKVQVQPEPFDLRMIEERKTELKQKMGFNDDEVAYFVLHEKLMNSAYSQKNRGIQLLRKDGTLTDVALASDQLNISALAAPVEKYCLAAPGL